MQCRWHIITVSYNIIINSIAAILLECVFFILIYGINDCHKIFWVALFRNATPPSYAVTVLHKNVTLRKEVDIITLLKQGVIPVW